MKKDSIRKSHDRGESWLNYRLNDAKTYPVIGFDSMHQSREGILRCLGATETVSDNQMAVAVKTL